MGESTARDLVGGDQPDWVAVLGALGDQGLNAAKVADCSGLSVSTVYRLRRGDQLRLSVPSQKMLMRLARWQLGKARADALASGVADAG